MQTLILTLHIIVCFLLVILVLLQSGKEGMGVIFGGGNSSVFGSAGAGGILAKLTTLMAIIFVITSLSYTYVTSNHTGSESAVLNVTIEEPPTPKQETPAVDKVAPPAEQKQDATLPSQPDASARQADTPPVNVEGEVKKGGAEEPKTARAQEGQTSQDKPADKK